VNVGNLAVVQVHVTGIGYPSHYSILYSSIILVTYVTPKTIIFTIYYTIIFLFIARKTSSTINSDGIHLVWERYTIHKKKIERKKFVKKRVLIS